MFAKKKVKFHFLKYMRLGGSNVCQKEQNILNFLIRQKLQSEFAVDSYRKEEKRGTKGDE